MNGLSMCFNDMFADGKAEAGTAFVAAAGSIGAVESFKDPGKMIFVDADAIVTDLYKYMPVIGFVNTGNDGAILFAILCLNSQQG